MEFKLFCKLTILMVAVFPTCFISSQLLYAGNGQSYYNGKWLVVPKDGAKAFNGELVGYEVIKKLSSAEQKEAAAASVRFDENLNKRMAKVTKNTKRNMSTFDRNMSNFDRNMADFDRNMANMEQNMANMDRNMSKTHSKKTKYRARLGYDTDEDTHEDTEEDMNTNKYRNNGKKNNFGTNNFNVNSNNYNSFNNYNNNFGKRTANKKLSFDTDEETDTNMITKKGKNNDKKNKGKTITKTIAQKYYSDKDVKKGNVVAVQNNVNSSNSGKGTANKKVIKNSKNKKPTANTKHVFANHGYIGKINNDADTNRGGETFSNFGNKY